MTDPINHHRRDAPVDARRERLGEQGEMIRSEERLLVGVEWVPSRGVRIGKRVVTETRTVTVDVRREELYYQEVPLSDITGGGDETGDRVPASFDLILHEEHVVVDRVVIPVERVRISVGRVDGTVDLAATVAQERIAVEQAIPARE